VKGRARFSPIANPSRSRQWKLGKAPNKEREAVVIPLPVSLHTGQIIMLTKMLTATDLRFYDFEAGASLERWR
jgi:hypothetical protein